MTDVVLRIVDSHVLKLFIGAAHFHLNIVVMKIVDPRDAKGRRLLHEGELDNVPTYDDIRILNSKEILDKVEILHNIPPSSVAFTNDYASLVNKPDIPSVVETKLAPVETRVSALEGAKHLTLEDVLAASGTYTGATTFTQPLNPAAGISMNGVLTLGYVGGDKSKLSSSIPLVLETPALTVTSGINVPSDPHFTSFSAMGEQVAVNADNIEALDRRLTVVEQAVGKVSPSSEVKPGAGIVSADAIIDYVSKRESLLKESLAPSSIVSPVAVYVSGAAVTNFVKDKMDAQRGEYAPADTLEPGHSHTTSDAILRHSEQLHSVILDEVAASQSAFIDGPTLEARVRSFITPETLKPVAVEKGLATLEDVDKKISEHDTGILDEVEESSPLPVKSSGIWKGLQTASSALWINEYRDIIEYMLRDRKNLELSTIHLLYSKSPTIMAVIQQMEVRERSRVANADGFTPEEWDTIRRVADRRSQLDAFLARTRVRDAKGNPVQDLPLYTDDVIRDEEV